MASAILFYVVSLASIAGFSSAYSIPFRKPCKDLSPERLKRSIRRLALPVLANGLEPPELGIDTLDPFVVKKIQACINSCRSTAEYNPVCGSNGITYENEGKLFCAKSCGVNVTLRRRSVCPPPATLGTSSPTITVPPPVERITSLSDFQRCMQTLCPITPSFTPVCGTDFITYMNIDRLKCAQKCGQDVKVLCKKPCAACGIAPGTPKTTNNN